MKNKELLQKFISTQGYKHNSPDKNRPFNVIPSGDITMKGVDHPVIGFDEYGNQQLMTPGNEYSFPGNTVVEVPLKEFQMGGRRPIYTSNPNDPRLRAYNDSLQVYNDWVRLESLGNNLSGDIYRTNTQYPRNPDGTICMECIRREAGRLNTNQSFRSNLWRQGATQLVNPNIRPIARTNFLEDNFFMDESRLQFYDYSNARPTQPVFYSPDNTSITKPNPPKPPIVNPKPPKPPDPAIVAKQEQLIKAGFNIGKADGIWGPKSKEAWKKYEEASKPKPAPVVNKPTTTPAPRAEIVKDERYHLPRNQAPVLPNGKMNPQVYRGAGTPGIKVDRYGEPIEPFLRMEFGGIKKIDPPKKNRRVVSFPSTETEFINTYGNMVQLPENFDTLLGYYTSNKRPSKLEIYEQDCVASGTCGPNTKTFINPIFSTVVSNPPITTSNPPFVPNPEIIAKQKQLKEAGLYSGKLDGIWGFKSNEAWKKYEESLKEKSKASNTDKKDNPPLMVVDKDQQFYLPRNQAPRLPSGDMNPQKLRYPGNFGGIKTDAQGNPIKLQQGGGLGANYMLGANPNILQRFVNTPQPLTREQALQLVNSGAIQNASDATYNNNQLYTNEQRAYAAANNADALRKRRLEDAARAEQELMTSDNWQQLIQRRSQATGDKFHSDYIPDWINPLVGIGDMVSGLGAVPYNIQQGNYGQAAFGVLAPVVTGALGSIGAQNTGQFLNNVVNPLAGLKPSRHDLSNISTYGRLGFAAETIKEEGDKIVNELLSPEGLKRLKQQLKEAKPELNDEQLDYIALTRINEVKEAIKYNKPQLLVNHIDKNFFNFQNSEHIIEEYFPTNNAHWSPHNPLFQERLKAPEKLFPQELSNSGINLHKPNGLQLFSDPHMKVGSITLGRNHETNVNILDHEIAHAIQKGGYLPIDLELEKLLPRDTANRIPTFMNRQNVSDKRNSILKKFFPRSGETLDSKNYFDFAGGRPVKNERYPFAVEQRRMMIENGILKDRYDTITPTKLLRARLAASLDSTPQFESGNRLINFTPVWKYRELAKIMNKMPAVIPPAVIISNNYNEQ